MALGLVGGVSMGMKGSKGKMTVIDGGGLLKLIMLTLLI